MNKDYEVVKFYRVEEYEAWLMRNKIEIVSVIEFNSQIVVTYSR